MDPKHGAGDLISHLAPVASSTSFMPACRGSFHRIPFHFGVELLLQHDNDAMGFSVTGGLLLAAERLPKDCQLQFENRHWD